MHHFFVSPDQIEGNGITITGTDVNHIRTVLRMKNGEQILVRTGEDRMIYRCRIDEITEEAVFASVLESGEEETELPGRITLYQCLPKSDKMEWIIQKAVELGAARIVPVVSHRCIVKLDEGKAGNKLRRWSAVAESAAKQSRRSVIPIVEMPVRFEQALKASSCEDVMLFPYECAEGMDYTRSILRSVKPGQSVGIMIGPEGGFDDEEVRAAREAGAKVISLGHRILRTETAGMTLIAALMLRLDGAEGGISSDIE